MAKDRRPRKRILKNVPKKCFFHEEGKEPSFSDIQVLQRYTTERGKLLPRSRSGLCAKHQKALTKAVKHARYLALLPFIVKG